MGSSVWKTASRLPVTLALLVALAASASLTGSVLSDLPGRFLRRFGFAPVDLWQLDLVRVFTSALVTHGGVVFAGALIMVGLSVGAVERRSGSGWAAGTFWGVHVWTLLMLSLTSYLAEGDPERTLGSTMATLRDVGPSAGYFGCLGFSVAALADRRGRLIVSALVVAWLTADLGGLVTFGATLPQEITADLAHLIAFPSGWLLGGAWNFQRVRARGRVLDAGPRQRLE